MAAVLRAGGGPDAEAPGVAGTWSCCGAGGAGAQTWVIKSSGSRLSGTGYEGTTPFSPISGSVNGTSVTIVTGPYIADKGYSATFVGKISASGTSMSGTWTSNVNQSGTWTAARTAGSPTTKPTKKQEEEAKEEERAKTKRPKAPLATSMVINCNQKMPGTPLAYFECTAEVANASLAEPLPTPSGVVSFTVNPGAGGGFRGSNLCSLKASEPPATRPPARSGTGLPPKASRPDPNRRSPAPTWATRPSRPAAPSSAQPRSPLPQVPQAGAQQSGSSVPLKMSCPAQTVCTGTAQLIASGAQASSASALAAGSAVVASGKYSVAAGGRATVGLHLTARGKALLKKHRHRLIVTLQIAPKSGSPTHKAIVLK